ncbi:hypothetical protein ACQEUX_12885 [Micromonospora sp. CA-259024]|uniref:hypothetical protein n=1 Tax=Micromonospora sp. CA-259024 TaxID=3239965 RepID=UPI003D8DAEE4
MVLFARAEGMQPRTGWIADRYHYLGASARQFNDVVLRSFEQGRVLHVIEWSGATVYRYLDSFVLEDVEYTALPRESDRVGTEVRVFRLAPVRYAIHVPDRFFEPASSGRAEVAPLQRHELIGGPPLAPASFELLRPEARLEHRFCQYLISQGRPAHRWRIYHTPGCKPLFNDFTIPGYQLLIEAKADCDRRSIREAIGQLADYTRHVDDVRHAILVPLRPERDLIELVHSTGAALIWPGSDGRWATTATYLAGLGLRVVSSEDA